MWQHLSFQCRRGFGVGAVHQPFERQQFSVILRCQGVCDWLWNTDVVLALADQWVMMFRIDDESATGQVLTSMAKIDVAAGQLMFF
jgi:hypothetical protein